MLQHTRAHTHTIQHQNMPLFTDRGILMSVVPAPCHRLRRRNDVLQSGGVLVLQEQNWTFQGKTGTIFCIFVLEKPNDASNFEPKTIPCLKPTQGAIHHGTHAENGQFRPNMFVGKYGGGHERHGQPGFIWTMGSTWMQVMESFPTLKNAPERRS